MPSARTPDTGLTLTMEHPMTKAKRRVTSMSGVIKAYGGREALARSFGVPADGHGVRTWLHAGVPRAHHLGLYPGLQQVGYQAQPKLFGVRSWRGLPGA